jgi:hypothetical protein
MPATMGEWWTYGLADFLMFAPRTYYRLLELYNAEIWPAQLAALALGLAIPALLRWGGAWRGRAVAAILAVAWAWVAWGFHWRHYATINWPATWFAAGFAIEAALLLGIGVLGERLRFGARRHPANAVGYGLLLFALLAQPIVGPMQGRPLTQVELFGVTPDPTVIATLGSLLLARGRMRWALLPIPLLWCAIGGATSWAMEASDSFLLPLAGLLVILAMIWRRAAKAEQEPRLEGPGSAGSC